MRVMERRSRPVFPAVILLLVLTPAFKVAAGESEVSLSARVDRAVITIGDLITYTVTASRDPSVEIRLPALGENLGGFEIRDYTPHRPRREEDRVIERVDYIISTFETGEFTIPPVEIGYRLSSDEDFRVLKTESIVIRVESVKPSEEGDIREIRPPWEIRAGLRLILIFGGIGLILLAAALTVWLVLKRRRTRKAADSPAEPAVPPHEAALAALLRLEGSDLLKKGRIKRFHSELSEIIRRYIEGRFRMDAMEMTTT